MSDNPPVLRAPNVYITGHSDDGASIIVPTKPLRWVEKDNGAVAGANVFVTNETPIDFSDRKDINFSENIISSGKLGFVHADGAICRYFDVAPGNSKFLHQTLSIDFAICVEGQMELQLDGGETRIMERGDVVIQRATMHSWRNPSKTEWCRLVAVMMPAKEFKVGEKKIEEKLGVYEKQ